MKITWLKYSNDKNSFNRLKRLGLQVQEIDDLEQTDNKINELINEKYTTIVMTNEVASFSENIIRKYDKLDSIKIIIAPNKL